MPYIDAKLTISLSSEQKEDLKSEFGKLISCLNKTETYLMQAHMFLSACSVMQDRISTIG